MAKGYSGLSLLAGTILLFKVANVNPVPGYSVTAGASIYTFPLLPFDCGLRDDHGWRNQRVDTRWAGSRQLVFPWPAGVRWCEPHSDCQMGYNRAGASRSSLYRRVS